jgi:hypothetical protein
MPLPGLTLHTADARDLPIESDTVGLIVTSPPYALDREYGVGSADWSVETWQDTLFDALEEARRITRLGGRLALNVPLDTRGCRPTYAQAVEAALMAGWRYGTTIIWHDDHLVNTAARGTVDSSAGPNIIARVEMIPLFVKGDEWLIRPCRETARTPSRTRIGWIGPAGSGASTGSPARGRTTRPPFHWSYRAA